MSFAGCTIVSPNYLPYARTVAASYLAQHPDRRFFVLIVADLRDPQPFVAEPFTPILVRDIGLLDLRAEAMKYDILELNTNVKPTFLKHLLTHYSLDAVVYLDPDIFVYAPLDPVWSELTAGANAVLTPHITTPVYDGRNPSEQDLLYNGTFNLGFLAVRSSEEALRLLSWWEARCLALGFSEGRTGLFVDQKWMNLAPVLFRGIATLLDAGCNMAYWNLHEHQLQAGNQVLSPVSGQTPLRFFHFSGLPLDDPTVLSHNTGRFTLLSSRPDLAPLFAAYSAAVKANRNPLTDALPFALTPSPTAPRSPGSRAASMPGTATASPAPTHLTLAARLPASRGPIAWLPARPLPPRRAGATSAPGTAVWTPSMPCYGSPSASSARTATIHALLRLTLRILGPHRYDLLMRYLSFITVLRHQAVFLRDRSWPAESARAEAAE